MFVNHRYGGSSYRKASILEPQSLFDENSAMPQTEMLAGQAHDSRHVLSANRTAGSDSAAAMGARFGDFVAHWKPS